MTSISLKKTINTDEMSHEEYLKLFVDRLFPVWHTLSIAWNTEHNNEGETIMAMTPHTYSQAYISAQRTMSMEAQHETRIAQMAMLTTQMGSAVPRNAIGYVATLQNVANASQALRARGEAAAQ